MIPVKMNVLCLRRKLCCGYFIDSYLSLLLFTPGRRPSPILKQTVCMPCKFERCCAPLSTSFLADQINKNNSSTRLLLNKLCRAYISYHPENDVHVLQPRIAVKDASRRDLKKKRPKKCMTGFVVETMLNDRATVAVFASTI